MENASPGDSDPTVRPPRKPAARSRIARMAATAKMGTIAVPASGPDPDDPIKHVIVPMVENRSFDHMLGSMKTLYPGLEGIDPNAPGTNQDEAGNTYSQKPDALFQLPYGVDPKHELVDVLDQLAGGCQGFIKNFLRSY